MRVRGTCAICDANLWEFFALLWPPTILVGVRNVVFGLSSKIHSVPWPMTCRVTIFSFAISKRASV